jgi:uncharacterized membrane protein required for colicin V production
VGFCLAGAIAMLFLAATKPTFDLYIHDRYLAILPSHLLLVSAAFFFCNAFRLEGQSSMNLRDLLKSLQAVDEKNLDMDVTLSPHSGGY